VKELAMLVLVAMGLPMMILLIPRPLSRRSRSALGPRSQSARHSGGSAVFGHRGGMAANLSRRWIMHARVIAPQCDDAVVPVAVDYIRRERVHSRSGDGASEPALAVASRALPSRSPEALEE
jgi:hypothetical protein